MNRIRRSPDSQTRLDHQVRGQTRPAVPALDLVRQAAFTHGYPPASGRGFSNTCGPFCGRCVFQKVPLGSCGPSCGPQKIPHFPFRSRWFLSSLWHQVCGGTRRAGPRASPTVPAPDVLRREPWQREDSGCLPGSSRSRVPRQKETLVRESSDVLRLSETTSYPAS